MPSSLRIISLEHAEAEGAGKIADWALQRGHVLQAVRLDLREPLPPLEDVDFLVIMGGAPNIYQDRDFPFLKAERAYVEEAALAGKVMLGVCLGAQLIADALGGRVTQNPVREIGWFPIQVENRDHLFAGFPQECTVFHWHGDTYSLPPGAVQMARSAACENQAFAFGDRIVGLQFHVELSATAAAAFTIGAEHALQLEEWVQSPEVIRAAQPDLSATDRGLEMLLDGLAAVAQSSQSEVLPERDLAG